MSLFCVKWISSLNGVRYGNLGVNYSFSIVVWMLIDEYKSLVEKFLPKNKWINKMKKVFALSLQMTLYNKVIQFVYLSKLPKQINWKSLKFALVICWISVIQWMWCNNSQTTFCLHIPDISKVCLPREKASEHECFLFRVLL